MDTRGMHARPATIRDVASLAGVSKSTASRALLNQGDVSAATRARIVAAANELRFVPNSMARRLADGGRATVGLLIRDATNPIYGHMQARLQEQAHRHATPMLAVTVVGPDIRAGEEEALADLLSNRVAGLLVCSGTVPSESIAALVDQAAVLSVGRPERHPDIDAVSYDEEDAGRALAEHMLRLGHRRLGVVRLPDENSQSHAVRAAATVAALRAGGAEIVELRRDATTTVADLAVRHAVGTDPITSVIASNDSEALDILHALATAGIRVPDDVSVSGCDAVGALAHPYLGLTSYAQPITQVAEQAFDRMLGRLADPALAPRHVLVAGELRAGSTSAPAPRRR